MFRRGSGAEDEDWRWSGELTPGWDPTSDARLTAWEMVHHLIRVPEAGGGCGAAVLAAKLGTKSEGARELCYRLSLCGRKKRAVEALSYNGLAQSWPEITRPRGKGHERTAKPFRNGVTHASPGDP